MAARAYIRFTNIDIPQYSIITSAYLRIKSYTDYTDSIDVNVYIVPDSNPSNPTSKAELDSLTTSAGVNWNITTNWSNNEYYQSPNISAGIQDIINMSDWSSGNPIMIVIEDNGSTSERLFYSFDSGDGADLFIDHINPIETASPVYDPVGGKYPGGTTITLSTITNGANIYYTTDGSTPDTSSGTYSSPIEITADFTLKAFAFKTGGGFIPSDIKSEDYELPEWSFYGYTDGLTGFYEFNDLFYAGQTTGTGNLWVYDGNSWQVEHNFGSSISVRAIGEHNGNLYVGTDDMNVYVKNGNTYTLDGNLASPSVGSLTDLQSYNGDLYACSGNNDGKVYRKSIGWISEHTPGWSCYDLEVHDGDLFVCTNNYVSTHNIHRKSGGTWSGFGKLEDRVHSMKSASDGNLYLATSDRHHEARIYQWDGGASFGLVCQHQYTGPRGFITQVGDYIYATGGPVYNSLQADRIDITSLIIGTNNREDFFRGEDETTGYDIGYYSVTGEFFLSSNDRNDGSGQSKLWIYS